MKSTSNLAVAIAAGLFFAASPMTAASAADLGGNCCADLEERVAELEATTVRKGNRKVSLKLYGFVHRAIMAWDSEGSGAGESDSDIYSVGGGTTAGSRFGMKGSAKIGGGWSAGYMLEYQVADTLASKVSQNNDDGKEGALSMRHDVLYLKNKQFGTIYMGHSSTSTDGIAEINLSGAKVATKGSAVQTWNSSFKVNSGNKWGSYLGNLDGGRGDAVIRYDTPTFAGFTASATYGEDDYWDAALRYANEFGGVLRVAAGIGYSVLSDEDSAGNEDTVTLNGSISAMHVPTGLNVSFAAGQREDDDFAGVENSYWHVTAGIKQKFSSLGATALYGEYGDYDLDNLRAGATNTEANMWGLGVVQKIDAAAMEIYAAYRSYELDTVADNSFSAVTVGTRIKF